ncbi:MAG: hypothetical protein RIK87_03570 [Fuerstiella sp.]
MTDTTEHREVVVGLGQLSLTDFEAQLESDFVVDLNYCGLSIAGEPVRQQRVYPEDSTFRLQLIEVKRLKSLSEHLRQEPFTLLFRGSHDLPLHSQAHVLEHESLGRLCLFLSPVNAGFGVPPEQHPDGRFYESVVN